MYSSGSPEGGSSSSESRTEFLDKLQRARGAVPSTAISQPILTSTGTETITVGNWTLNCRQENQLVVINTDGQQATILKEELPGFLFESNRGTKHTFTAETTLGLYWFLLIISATLHLICQETEIPPRRYCISVFRSFHQESQKQKKLKSIF